MGYKQTSNRRPKTVITHRNSVTTAGSFQLMAYKYHDSQTEGRNNSRESNNRVTAISFTALPGLLLLDLLQRLLKLAGMSTAALYRNLRMNTRIVEFTAF